MIRNQRGAECYALLRSDLDSHRALPRCGLDRRAILHHGFPVRLSGTGLHWRIAFRIALRDCATRCAYRELAGPPSQSG